MTLTWKSPSDNAQMDVVTPVRWHDLNNFLVVYLGDVAQERTLHINAIKVDGEYLETPKMWRVVNDYLNLKRP